MRAKNIFLSVLLLAVGAGEAKAGPGKWNELGTPIIRNYAISEFAESAEGELPQTWSATMDRRGVLYFGLWRNIVQFDGQHWKSIPIPSGPAYGLCTDSAGTIFVSMVGDFGYLAGDAKGAFRYVSLLDKLPEEAKKPATLWNVRATSHGVYFVGSGMIYRFRDGTVTALEEEVADKGFLVNDSVYIANSNGQLAVISDGRVFRIPYFDRLAESEHAGKAVAMPSTDGKALIVTDRKGAFIHDLSAFLDASKEADGSSSFDSYVKPLETEAEDYFKANSVYSAARLDDRRYAVGTYNGGLVIFDDTGGLVQIANANRGLGDDLVLDVLVDGEGNLWAGTNSGISYISTSSALTVFDANNGIDSMVLFVIRHSDTIFFSTFQGIYWLPAHELQVKDDRYLVNHLENTSSQVFRMMEYKGGLLAADDAVVAQIEEGKYRKVVEMGETVLTFATAQKFPDYVFVGMGVGIRLMKMTVEETPTSPTQSRQADPEINAELVPNEALAGLESSFYEIASDANGDLWASSENNGLYQISWFGDGIGDFEIFHYGVEDGLPALTDNNAFIVEGRVLVATKKGVYRIESVAEPKKGEKPAKIVRDDAIEPGFWENPPLIWHIQTDSGGNTWLSNQERMGALRERADGKYSWDTSDLTTLSVKVITHFADRDGVIWIGGERALYRYDSAQKKDRAKDYFALIRRVTAAEKKVLLSGDFFDPGSEEAGLRTRVASSQPASAAPILEYRDNSVSFEYSAAFYEKPENTRFRYQLKGFDKHPSDWVRSTAKEYTNLPEGDYVFEVEAKNTFGRTSRPATYAFKILPPWYRTWWAYLCYAVAAVLFLIVSVRLYTWRLVLARERLKKIVKERTKEVVRQKDEIALQRDQITEQRDQIKRANDALWGEMELAKKIQTVLLPEEPQIPGYEIAGYMDPADEVGGDYYDIFNIKNTNWIVIGDVSGHGVPAGLVMMMVQTSIRSVLEYFSDATPDKILTLVNRVIYENIHKLSEHRYMTITLFSVHESGGMYFSGLHQDLLIFRAETGRVEIVETDGSWIGMVEDIDGLLQVGELELNTGDTLLLYTDGITEAADIKGNMFSKKKLAEILQRRGDRQASEIKLDLINSLGGYTRNDDITFVVVKKL